MRGVRKKRTQHGSTFYIWFPQNRLPRGRDFDLYVMLKYSETSLVQKKEMRRRTESRADGNEAVSPLIHKKACTVTSQRAAELLDGYSAA